MPTFWERLFGHKKQQAGSLSLLDYAENYLTVFEVASNAEKTRHASQLFKAANDTVRQVGSVDFLALIENSDVSALGQAAVYSRERFEKINAEKGGYWLSAYALTHLMILNSVKSLENAPRAKLTAQNAAQLYSAEYTRRELL